MIKQTWMAAVLAAFPLVADAQDTAWVQVEAEKSLSAAQDRARAYARSQENVSGFQLGSGWYAITLGPYSPAEADAVLRRLKAAGSIPGDSYIVEGDAYRGRFWPLGDNSAAGDAQIATAAPAAPSAAPATAAAAAPAPSPDAPPPLRDPGETAQEARASESELDKPAKQELQIALQWAGHYNGAIDGLYGRGTRNSMAAWQAANNYPETGILTTSQRAELITAYNAVLEGMDLQLVQDDASGIRMQIPTGVVDFARYDPPFVRYDATGSVPAQVLLISQQGDRETLAGLYRVMQTLEIVPPEGPREAKRDSFTLEGLSDSVHSYTQASLDGGVIKGFTLIWPAGDEERRSRVLGEMRKSFTRIDGVLDPQIVPPSPDQSADLISGLAIRKPIRTRSGVYLNDQGQVLTSADAVAECGSVEVDGGVAATVALTDPDLGIAVLTPDTGLSPQAHAVFQTAVPRLKSNVALAGFPFGGVLPRAAMTFGTLEDLRGLDGEEYLDRLAISARPTEAGGPVFDNTGQVTGILTSQSNAAGKTLPGGVAFAIDAAAILPVLDAAAIGTERGDEQSYQTQEQITELAGQMTVLVRCWE